MGFLLLIAVAIIGFQTARFSKRVWIGLTALAVIQVAGSVLLTPFDLNLIGVLGNFVIRLAMAAIAYAIGYGIARLFKARRVSDSGRAPAVVVAPDKPRSPQRPMRDNTIVLIAIVWQAGSLATFVYLTFFDGYVYTWWNWLIALPVNVLLAELWPIYWLILRPIMGH